MVLRLLHMLVVKVLETIVVLLLQQMCYYNGYSGCFYKLPFFSGLNVTVSNSLVHNTVNNESLTV